MSQPCRCTLGLEFCVSIAMRGSSMLGNASLESDGQGRWSCPLCVPLLSHSLPGAERELDAALAVQASVNVVQVYGFCFDAPDARIRIVTEHCSHGTLREHVKELPQVCGRRCVALQTHGSRPLSRPLATVPSSFVVLAHAGIRDGHLCPTDDGCAAAALLRNPASRHERGEGPRRGASRVADSAGAEVGGLW